jgi:curved DNA-binding protein CbpA
VLELGADATEDQIKAAYHVLVKVWHPDRFQSDKTLKDAAETKLKNVNSAYVFLCSAAGKAPRSHQTPSAGAAAQRPAASASQQQTASGEQPRAARPQTRRATRTRPMASVSTSLFPALKLGLGFILIAFALLMARYLWIAFDTQGSADGIADAFDGNKDSLRSFLNAPRQRFLAAVKQDLRRLDPRGPAPGALPQAAEVSPSAASQSPQAASTNAVGRQPAKVRASPLKLYSYITVGSTRDEVIAQQGPPTASSVDKLAYGSSELDLKDGSVVGWKIDPRSPIKVKLWPESSVDPSLDHFTIGSTKDVVLVVQGTPTAFTQDKFEYGRSVVYFQNNRVVNWKSDPASIPLRARPD